VACTYAADDVGLGGKARVMLRGREEEGREKVVGSRGGTVLKREPQ